MQWMIEIRLDVDGKPVSMMPALTVNTGDDIVWFVQSTRQRPFEVRWGWVDESAEFQLPWPLAELPEFEEDGPRRDPTRVLASLPVQAVRLRVDEGHEGRVAGYRIVFTDSDGKSAAGTIAGMIHIGTRFIAMSTGPRVQEGRENRV